MRITVNIYQIMKYLKCQAHCLALILLVTFVIQLLNSSIFVNLMNLMKSF